MHYLHFETTWDGRKLIVTVYKRDACLFLQNTRYHLPNSPWLLSSDSPVDDDAPYIFSNRQQAGHLHIPTAVFPVFPLSPPYFPFCIFSIKRKTSPVVPIKKQQNKQSWSLIFFFSSERFSPLTLIALELALLPQPASKKRKNREKIHKNLSLSLSLSSLFSLFM